MQILAFVGFPLSAGDPMEGLGEVLRRGKSVGNLYDLTNWQGANATNWDLNTGTVGVRSELIGVNSRTLLVHWPLAQLPVGRYHKHVQICHHMPIDARTPPNDPLVGLFVFCTWAVVLQKTADSRQHRLKFVFSGVSFLEHFCEKNWFTFSAVIAVFFLASSRVISLNQIQIYHDLSKYIHQLIIYNLMFIGITHYHRKLKTTLKNRCNEHTNYRSCLLYARNYNLGVALENCCITAFLVINLKLTSTFSTTPFQSSHAPLIIYVYTHSCLHYFPFYAFLSCCLYPSILL